MYLVIEAVQPLPLFGRNLFPYLPRIFPCRIDAGCDGSRMLLVVDEFFSHRLRVTVPHKIWKVPERCDKSLPMRLSARTARVQHESHGYVEQTGGILGAFQVAAHPIKAVGNARKHLLFSRTA